MDVFRVIVNNSFKKNLRKKIINVLTSFSISYKSYVKIFLEQIINNYPKDTR